MAAWHTMRDEIAAALMAAGYVVAPEPVDQWPSWAIGADGAGRWVALSVTPSSGDLGGSDAAMIRHRVTVRGLAGLPMSPDSTDGAALDLARSLRATIETTAGYVSGTAHAVAADTTVDPFGAGLRLVAVAFDVHQLDQF